MISLRLGQSHCSIYKKDKSKSGGIVFLLFAILLWVVMAFNYDNADYATYEMIYNHVVRYRIFYSGVEPGYNILMLLSGGIGFDYSQFLFLYSTVNVCLFGIYAYKNADRPDFLILLYAIYPFFDNVVNLRSSMALVVFLLSSQYLYGERKSNIKFIIGVLVSSLLHRSCLAYLILLLVNIDINVIRRFVKIMLPLEIIFTLFASRFIAGLFSGKIAYYLTKGLSGTRLETKIILVIFFCSIIYLCDYLSKKVYCGDKNFPDIAIKSGYLSVLICPLVFFDMDFFRVERGFLIVMYTLLCNYVYRNKPARGKLPISYFYVLGYVCVIAITFYFMFSSGQMVRILSNNYIFDLFK